MPTDQHTTHDPAQDEKVKEADFLQQEAERAKAAIAQTLGELRSSLGRVADPHRLTQKHPFVAVGVAAIAGFAAAAALVPSREQQAVKALAAIERSLRQPTVEPEKSEEKKEAAASSGWVQTLIAEIVKLIRPLLTTLITTSLSGMNAAQNEPQDGAIDPGEQPAVSSPS